ncbi:MAG: acyloxyacyl hydrolase [Planctomycetota bacterium]
MQRRVGASFAAWLWLTPLFFGGAGCAHGFHEDGARQVTAHASYGDPRTDDPLWWIGNGDAKNVGLTVGYNYFFADDWALLTAITPLRRYSQAGQTVTAVEFQIGVRAFLWSTGVTETSKLGVFFDVLGGVMVGDNRVPDGGTKTNLMADFGPGAEYRFNDKWSLLAGYRLHHISNIGPTETSNNPSQNDNQYWLGVGYSW